MARHTCADCGYEYSEAEIQQTSPEQRSCPQCGGTGVNVEVFAQAALGVGMAGTVSILITTHLWLSWLGIAIDQAQAARRARNEAVTAGQSND